MAVQPARPTRTTRPVARRPVDDDVEETVKPAHGMFRRMCGAVLRVFAPPSVLRVLVLCAMFGGVIGAGVYATKDPHGLLRSIAPGKGTSSIAHAGRPDLPLGASSTPDNDPVKHFAKTGIGQVVFSGQSTDSCKRTLFDNRTGGYREVADVFCGQTPDQVTEAQSGDRLESMRKGFKK